MCEQGCNVGDMTAAEIINEIEHLAPGERERVVTYLRRIEGEQPLSGDELASLAGKLADLADPAEVDGLKERIAAGFYGRQRHA